MSDLCHDLSEGYRLRGLFREFAGPGRRGKKTTGRWAYFSYKSSGKTFRTYIAVSACGRFAKVGRSRQPASRVRDSQDIRDAARALGVSGWLLLARVYRRDVERECHRFLAPDRVYGREWYRVSARLRILVNRLDRKSRRLP